MHFIKYQQIAAITVNFLSLILVTETSDYLLKSDLAISHDRQILLKRVRYLFFAA